MSGVSMPRCNIDLKPSVSGNGNLTVFLVVSHKSEQGNGNVLRTKPWKKKLIHPMITIWGTIMTICVFMPDIIPSMAAGSASGFGGVDGVSPFGGPSFKYVPSAKALERFCEMVL